MKALVDGDILRYRIGFACESKTYSITINGEEEWGARATFDKKKDLNQWIEDHGLKEDEYQVDTTVVADPIEFCLHSVKLQMNSILEGAGADSYQVYLSGKDNFRDKLATIRPYKGTRPDRKPFHYDNITTYLIDKWGAVVIEGQEADDALSIAQYKAWTLNGGMDDEWFMRGNSGTIIATIDKDLDCCPGWHYNFVKDVKYWVDEDTANEWFYCQLIMGDTVDNIQGVPGAGKKKAYEVLSKCHTEMERYQAVLKLYTNISDKNKPENYPSALEALVENGRLLWMRRYTDEMWTPPI